jgi:hypothetical protein
MRYFLQYLRYLEALIAKRNGKLSRPQVIDMMQTSIDMHFAKIQVGVRHSYVHVRMAVHRSRLWVSSMCRDSIHPS